MIVVRDLFLIGLLCVPDPLRSPQIHQVKYGHGGNYNLQGLATFKGGVESLVDPIGFSFSIFICQLSLAEKRKEKKKTRQKETQ